MAKARAEFRGQAGELDFMTGPNPNVLLPEECARSTRRLRPVDSEFRKLPPRGQPPGAWDHPACP